MNTLAPEQLNAMRERTDELLDGNHAALHTLTRLVDGLCGYPITPSTPIAEDFARAASNGVRNLFDHELMYFQPSGELSVVYEPLLNAVHWVIPDLSRLDIRSAALYGTWPDMNATVWASLHVAHYCAIALALAMLFFQRRELS